MASFSMVQMSLNEYNELYDAKKKINKIIGELHKTQKAHKDLDACQDCIQHLMSNLMSIVCDDITLVPAKK